MYKVLNLWMCFNYDENSLICYDMSVYYNEGKLKEKPFYHMIISKKDGSVVKGIFSSI